MEAVDDVYFFPHSGYNHYFFPIVKWLASQKGGTVRFVMQSNNSSDFIFFEKDYNYSDGCITSDEMIRRLRSNTEMVRGSQFSCLVTKNMELGKFDFDDPIKLSEFKPTRFISGKADYLRFLYQIHMKDSREYYTIEQIILPYSLETAIKVYREFFSEASNTKGLIVNPKLSRSYEAEAPYFKKLIDESDEVIASHRNTLQRTLIMLGLDASKIVAHPGNYEYKRPYFFTSPIVEQVKGSQEKNNGQPDLFQDVHKYLKERETRSESDTDQ